MNSKLLPSLIVVVLSIYILQNNFMGNNKAGKNNQHNTQHTTACPSAAPPIKEDNASGPVKEAMSSYPSIMYLDM
ncbi:MAG: hypothetical protein IPP72_21770 [Chitinophagaceae bacterium]|nr:hypothetical protein [Chitinophagaceae bacterium]